MKPMHRLIYSLVFVVILAFIGGCVKNIGQLPIENHVSPGLPINWQVNPGVLTICGIPEKLTYSGSTSTIVSGNLSPFSISPGAAAGAHNMAMFADQSLSDKGVLVYSQQLGFIGTNSLSQARSGIGAGSVDNNMFFAGGQFTLPGSADINFSEVVDIFQVSNGPVLKNTTRSTAALSVPRVLPAVGSAGHVIAFGGGIVAGDPYANSNVVDIFNDGNNTWSTSQLSTGRAFLAAAGWGTKILFGGGQDITSTIPTDLVDIYDINSATWTISRLSQARSHLAAAATCNKIFFAGGVLSNASASDRVDIYDVPTGTWSTAQLSEPRIDLFGVAAGNRIFFGGGFKDIALNPSTTVDVYDNSSGTWSTFPLSGKRLAGASASNKAVFIGDTQADIFTLGQ